MVRKTYLCFLLIVLWAATACAAPPRRIVSVSPNLTEIIYGLGVFDRVVGVTDYCTYPPEAKSRERVGGWSTPNLERIVRLHPDRLRDTLGLAICVVTHDLHLIDSAFDRVLALRNGQLIVDDRPDKVLNDSTLAAVYEDQSIRTRNFEGRTLVWCD